MTKQINFSVINLWCSKNLVDSEFVIWELLKSCHFDSKSWKFQQQFNFFPNFEDEKVEFVILNTCGFLSTARMEAEDMMEYLDTIGKKIILIGCYLSVKDDEFLMSLKNLETIISYKDIKNIQKILLSLKDKTKFIQKSASIQTNLSNFKKEKLKNYLKNIWWNQIKNFAYIFWTDATRALLNAEKWYEYLKISEWCDNNCSFCIIPCIRWKQKSRPIKDIIKEVKIMLNFWIKEIEIIAQDITRYWVDIYKTPKLLELLEEIDKIPWDFKYRLFYMYPDILMLEHLEKLSKLQKFIPYFDFPFQHISPKILKRMGRFYDDKHIYKLLDYIKILFKNPFFHTNFIIGFPWETNDDFEILLDFAKKIKFDSISIFGYHDEPLASSSKLDNKIPEKTIIERVKKIRKILDEIYKIKEESLKWKELIGFIEQIWENFVLIRSEIKAPEIDDLDKVRFKDILEWNIEIGNKVKYKIWF